jgi:Protein of unknown function (DUF732)/Protein of unknown function (DUF2510)
MTTPQQPDWYDDPHDPNAERYWDGNEWTPHRRRRPISRPAQPPPPPPQLPTQPAELPLPLAERPTQMRELPMQPGPPPPELPPPPEVSPSAVEYPPPPSGGSPRPSRSLTAVIAVIGLVAVLAVAGFLVVYKFVWTHHSSSSSSPPTSLEAGAPTHSGPRAPTHSGPGAPTHSGPVAPTTGGQNKYLSDLATVGITSSTASPEALVARGQKACSGLAAGQSQDEVAADIVSSSNHFFDQSSADNIVRMAVKDLCPQQR